ncbi:MAG TPA: hypothetical protein VJL58_02875, partial [Pyrinomonadaceae bacterium]|nr:hypothetical protein [Pyrinomonadaceae bacterium]
MKTNIPNIAVITLRSLCASLLNHHFARVAIIIGLWYLGLGSQLVLAQSFQCTTTQVTSSVGDWGSSGTSAGRFASANGKRLTFNSSGNFTGGDPDQNGEVYIYDEDTGYTQVTNTNTAGVSGGSNGTLSSNGKRTVFMSYLNLSGQNPDGNDELFLHDSDTGITSQITNTTGFAWIGIGIINANGTKVAFNSQRNLTGGNSDGSMEGFVYDIAAGTTVQITNGIGKDSGVYSVSGDGTRIGIVSNADLVPNQNADGNFEVFVFDSVTGFIQVTVTFGNYFSHGVFLSSDGNHVVYTSNYPLVGNADGNYEIYLFDFADESLTQVTNTTGSGNQSTGISADGSRAIFFSNRNLTGNNSDGNSELFLYDVLSATTTQ